jgi:hypothetical protein
MFGLDDYHAALRFKLRHYYIRDLGSQPLLDLRPAGKNLHYPGEFA